MNRPNVTGPNPMKSPPSPETEPLPISISVLVVIADARKRKRVLARRGQAFATTAEALAALPSQLHLLIRAVGGDAQVELSKFLELLAQPEPPLEELPPASASPGPATCVAPEPETPVAEPTLELPAEPPAPAEDYLIPLALPLLATLP